MDRDVLSDRYTLLRVLGGGGMAQVYLARDGVLEREVALKVLRERYAEDEGFVERFRREAKNVASLNHPAVVQVYDQGRAEDGAYFIAMEYVPGGTLKDRVARDGHLDPTEAAAVASRVADALAEAHRSGIVHRDIKPQNVLLGASGEAKVADFGIARAATSQTMTETNMVFGTAAYMSPEHVRGERVGPASDLYSLGVVLYEMLTGKLPYEAGEPIATAVKRLEAPPPHPRDVNPLVPAEMDSLVVRLLATDPEERYLGAAELARDLRRISEGLPPLAAGAPLEAVTRTNPTVAAPRRGAPRSGDGTLLRPVPWAPVLALVVLALLGGVAWALTRSPSEEGPSDAGRNPGGAALAEVPDVTGLSPEEARGRLQDADLGLGSRDEATSERAEQGTVVGQDPAAGSRAEEGSAVAVTVGTGPARGAADQPSPTASPEASPTSSPSPPPTGSASPASAAGGQEAAKRREEAREEAQKRAEERRKAREEAREERQKMREEARKEAEE